MKKPFIVYRYSSVKKLTSKKGIGEKIRSVKKLICKKYTCKKYPGKKMSYVKNSVVKNIRVKKSDPGNTSVLCNRSHATTKTQL